MSWEALGWGALLFAGLVVLAIVLGNLAARLLLDAARNGEPEPGATPESHARKGDAEIR